MGSRVSAHQRFSPDQDALLAVATQDRGYDLVAGKKILSDSDQADLRRNRIEPALHNGDWVGAATAAATGLNKGAGSTGGMSLVGLAIVLAVVAVAVVALLLWRRNRRRKRREAELAAAQRVDPADPNAWPRCRSTRSTTCRSPSSWRSTTPSGPVTTS